MNIPLRIGLAGLGTVGGGVVALLRENAVLIAQRTGCELRITAVAARDEAKARSVMPEGARFIKDAAALASDPEIDLVVEVIGGSEGVARALVEQALKNGKPVVTANKALIAHHGRALAQLAETSGAVLAFEAAVAGGIPIIKALRDGLAANRITRIAGILNGTCNYILTRMWEEKLLFAEVLADAQKLGYAEAEPSFDIDGIDTAHKTAILASLAFGGAPDIHGVHVEGIRAITLADMEYADALGFRIKLLGIAEAAEGGVRARVHPCLVPIDAPLATVHGVYNAVVAEGDAVGQVFFEGRGAGAGPTASAVVADIIDIARGGTYKPFTLPAALLSAAAPLSLAQLECVYYLRLRVADQAGVLARITGALSEHGVSVQAMLQYPHAEGENAEIVVTTHPVQEEEMQRVLAEIARLPNLRAAPLALRIEA